MNLMSMMNLFCLQFDMSWEQKTPNHVRVSQLLDENRPPAGSLVLLPEMFATGFSMNVDATSDSESHESQEFLRKEAMGRELYLMGGIVERDAAGRGINQSVTYGPDGREVARYSKMRTFTPGGESDHYARGSSVTLFEWNGFTVAPLICYDLRFPELFREAMSRGANLFAVIASWPSPRIEHWTVLARARAIENQAYFAGVSRSGSDPYFSYLGRSLIVDPRGKILSEAGDEECLIGAHVDLESLKAYRAELPFLCDFQN